MAVAAVYGRKTWHLLPHDAAAIANLARQLGVSPIVAQLLLNRKLPEPDQARRFLAAPLTGLYEPEALPGVVAAVDHLMGAVAQGKRICIYGDYDVDGVTGTAILLTGLKLLGARVNYHIPHRLEEGYGLNSETLGRLAQEGHQVVVTVDCGITSIREAAEARRLGLQLIITDHHEPKSELPEADVLVHPRIGGQWADRSRSRETSEPPAEVSRLQLRSDVFGYLSGAGVAFKLAWALCKRSCGSAKVTPRLREFLLDGVALAALGTVADVVPLHDENRILVRHGLARLRQAPSQGLKALMKVAGLESKRKLAAGDIGFILGPRLNAAGRVDTARLAVELLTTASAEQAADMAQKLEEQNQQRQALERQTLGQARALAEGDPEASALVLAHADWHPGILGIVASRLVDLFGRPTLMIAFPGGQDLGQGSGRSIPGFKLHEALQACTQDLLSHGGHAAAAGFRILEPALDAFRQRFCELARRQFGPTPPSPRLVIDAEVPLAALTPGLVQAIDQLEPYGSGNPQPLFLAGGLQVLGEPRKVGGGERHLSFRVRQQGRDMRTIAFGMAERAEELMSAAGACNLVFTPKINDWQGMRSVELEVRDFQAGTEARLGS